MVVFETPTRDPEDGFWRSRITYEDITLDVDKRSNSWIADVPEEHRVNGRAARIDVLPWIAAELQRRVRKLEKAERAAAEPEDDE